MEKELAIRNFFKTLSNEDIANSVYLFGLDFNKISLDSLFGYLIALYNEVIVLKDMVDRNFEQREGEHVLLPKDPKVQSVIIGDYYRKEGVLLKILNNKDVYELFIDYTAKQVTSGK